MSAWLFASLGTVAVLVGLLVKGSWPDIAIGIGGPAVGVAVAVLVFAKQRTDSRLDFAAAKDHTTLEADRVVAAVAEVMVAPSSSDEKSPEAELGSASAEQRAEDDDAVRRAAVRRNIGDGPEWSVFAARDVPLFVLADVVEGWRRKKTDGAKPMRDGDWRVANLIGAAKQTGEGERPWYILFDDEGDDVVWRLWRGASVPSVRRLRREVEA